MRPFFACENNSTTRWQALLAGAFLFPHTHHLKVIWHRLRRNVTQISAQYGADCHAIYTLLPCHLCYIVSSSQPDDKFIGGEWHSSLHYIVERLAKDGGCQLLQALGKKVNNSFKNSLQPHAGSFQIEVQNLSGVWHMENTTGACLAAGGVKPPKSPAEDLSNAKKEENIRPPP